MKKLAISHSDNLLGTWVRYEIFGSKSDNSSELKLIRAKYGMKIGLRVWYIISFFLLISYLLFYATLLTRLENTFLAHMLGWRGPGPPFPPSIWTGLFVCEKSFLHTYVHWEYKKSLEMWPNQRYLCICVVKWVLLSRQLYKIDRFVSNWLVIMKYKIFRILWFHNDVFWYRDHS